MRYIDLAGWGGPEVLKIAERAAPEPAAGEILIKVVAAGINRADLLQRQGRYPPPAGASSILGMEVSGYIAKIGSAVAPEWKAGDAICALIPGGGYAEYCVVDAGSCLRVPQSLTMAEAAALPEAVFTVWANLFATSYLKANDLFLMQGGSSGIGTTAIQMAKAFGARVIATAGSREKCDACVSLGAERAFHYREEDWEAAAMEWSREHGIDAILDIVGGDYFSRHLKLLAPGGRLVQIAYVHGAEVRADLRTIMTKRLVVTGSTLRPRSVEEKRVLRDQIEERVWPLLEGGKIRPVIDRVFPLAEVADAHRRMESSEHIGKLLLQISAG